MLKLQINLNGETQTIKMEHSLRSISKWESEKERLFFPPDRKTEISGIDMLDYFGYMILDRDDETDVINAFSPEQLTKITEYIASARTATTVREIQEKPGPKENISSELVYYWMISFQIPFDCDQWHLNRLMTLIRVCSAKNTKQKKRSPTETAKSFRELNEQRKKQLGTSG